jgi:hypothetical protein
MCEYMNNVFDMFLLVFVTEKNRKIVFESIETWTSTQSNVFSDVSSFTMVFPGNYRGLRFIELDQSDKGDGAVIFREAIPIALRLYIYYD